MLKLKEKLLIWTKKEKKKNLISKDNNIHKIIKYKIMIILNKISDHIYNHLRWDKMYWKQE